MLRHDENCFLDPSCDGCSSDYLQDRSRAYGFLKSLTTTGELLRFRGFINDLLSKVAAPLKPEQHMEITNETLKADF
jgi:hypothetical protein